MSGKQLQFYFFYIETGFNLLEATFKCALERTQKNVSSGCDPDCSISINSDSQRIGSN